MAKTSPIKNWDEGKMLMVKRYLEHSLKVSYIKMKNKGISSPHKIVTHLFQVCYNLYKQSREQDLTPVWKLLVPPIRFRSTWLLIKGQQGVWSFWQGTREELMDGSQLLLSHPFKYRSSATLVAISQTACQIMLGMWKLLFLLFIQAQDLKKVFYSFRGLVFRNL